FKASIDKHGLKHKRNDLNGVRKKVPLLARQAPSHTAEASKVDSTSSATASSTASTANSNSQTSSASLNYLDKASMLELGFLSVM
ncbi:7952_t:CDS:2, partial [Cetraspora pellucida]